jgi:hypothetical protein
MFFNIMMFAFYLQNVLIELELFYCQNQLFFFSLVNLQCLFLRLSDGIFNISRRIFVGKLLALIWTFRTASVFLTFLDAGLFEYFTVLIFLRRLVGFLNSSPPPPLPPVF